MDIPLGSQAAHKFVTNVGLITTDGPNGPNVMACEWTHHIAHEPGLILISVAAADTTAENIVATRQFGVSLAAEGHNLIASVAGGWHGRDVDKIALLKELGLEFYDGHEIRVPMIAGAAMNAECRVIDIKEMGGQLVVVGEAIDLRTSEQPPLVYHGGKYYKLDMPIQKPPQQVRDKIRRMADEHAR